MGDRKNRKGTKHNLCLTYLNKHHLSFVIYLLGYSEISDLTLIFFYLIAVPVIEDSCEAASSLMDCLITEYFKNFNKYYKKSKQ